MIKLSRMIAPVLAACLMLTGCFTSEQPLFNAKASAPIMGVGKVAVVAHEEDDKPDGGVLTWTSEGYLDESDEDKATVSFHRLPGTWPWDNWYIGQTSLTPDSDGYIYALYRKVGADRLNIYDVSCSDLTDVEIAKTHLARSESGQECKATRQRDLAHAFRILAKRTPSKSYWTFEPAKAP